MICLLGMDGLPHFNSTLAYFPLGPLWQIFDLIKNFLNGIVYEEFFFSTRQLTSRFEKYSKRTCFLRIGAWLSKQRWLGVKWKKTDGHDMQFILINKSHNVRAVFPQSQSLSSQHCVRFIKILGLGTLSVHRHKFAGKQDFPEKPISRWKRTKKGFHATP